MKKTIFIIMIALVLGSLSLVACAKSTPTPASTSASTPATTSKLTTTPAATTTASPQYGGVLKIIMMPAARGPGWPPEITGFETHYAWPCLESLWFIDQQGNLQPWLATNWEIAPGWKSITFHLRKGVKFHDGTDWNAKAAKWMMDAYVAAKAAGTDAWQSIEIIDDYTIRLNLSVFQNTQAQNIGFTMFISPTAIEKNGIDWARWNPVGTGPFKLKSFQRSVSAEYERFDGYWGDKPYLDGIKILQVQDQMTGSASFQAGEVHVLMFPGLDNPKLASDIKNLGYKTTTGNLFPFWLMPDSKDPKSPLTNKLVRQAVQYAINNEDMCKVIGLGMWNPMHQLFSNIMYGYNKDIQERKYDVEKAKQLVAQAGYPDGFKVNLNSGPNNLQDMLTVIQSYLAKVGITANINVVDDAKRREMVEKSGWSGFMGPESSSVTGGECAYFLQYRFGASSYVYVQRSEGFNDLVTKIMTAEDNNVRDDLTRQLSKLVNDDAMVIPLWSSGQAVFERAGVHGVQFYQDRTRYWWAPNKIWLDKNVQ